MNILAEKVRFDDDSIWVDLSDGRTIGVPLAWFPRLLNAAKSELDNFTISPGGIHWASLDEDISVEGLLAGKGDQSKSGDQAA